MKLSATISVSRRPRTDNEAELASVITNKTMQMGLKDFDQAVKDLKGAGIVVGEDQMTLEASKVKITNNGSTAALFTNGKVSADYIDAKTIVTEGLQANTIDAKDATIENLNVSGSITAAELNLSSFDYSESTNKKYMPLKGAFVSGPAYVTLPKLPEDQTRTVFFVSPIGTRIGFTGISLQTEDGASILVENSSGSYSYFTEYAISGYSGILYGSGSSWFIFKFVSITVS